MNYLTKNSGVRVNSYFAKGFVDVVEPTETLDLREGEGGGKDPRKG